MNILVVFILVLFIFIYLLSLFFTVYKHSYGHVKYVLDTFF